MLHGGMHSRREQEPDANLPDRGSRALGRERHANPQRFQQIRAAAAARNGAVSVFGNAHPCAGHHERRDGGDIKGSRGIAARAAGIEQRLAILPIQVSAHRRGDAAHGSSEADQLLRRFPFHAQSHQEGGNLRVAGGTGEDGFHRLLRLIGREIFSPNYALEVGQKQHAIV